MELTRLRALTDEKIYQSEDVEFYSKKDPWKQKRIFFRSVYEGNDAGLMCV